MRKKQMTKSQKFTMTTPYGRLTNVTRTIILNTYVQYGTTGVVLVFRFLEIPVVLGLDIELNCKQTKNLSCKNQSETTHQNVLPSHSSKPSYVLLLVYMCDQKWLLVNVTQIKFESEWFLKNTCFSLLQFNNVNRTCHDYNLTICRIQNCMTTCTRKVRKHELVRAKRSRQIYNVSTPRKGTQL